MINNKKLILDSIDLHYVTNQNFKQLVNDNINSLNTESVQAYVLENILLTHNNQLSSFLLETKKNIISIKEATVFDINENAKNYLQFLIFSYQNPKDKSNKKIMAEIASQDFLLHRDLIKISKFQKNEILEQIENLSVNLLLEQDSNNSEENLKTNPEKPEKKASDPKAGKPSKNFLAKAFSKVVSWFASIGSWLKNLVKSISEPIAQFFFGTSIPVISAALQYAFVESKKSISVNIDEFLNGLQDTINKVSPRLNIFQKAKAKEIDPQDTGKMFNMSKAMITFLNHLLNSPSKVEKIGMNLRNLPAFLMELFTSFKSAFSSSVTKPLAADLATATSNESKRNDDNNLLNEVLETMGAALATGGSAFATGTSVVSAISGFALPFLAILFLVYLFKGAAKKLGILDNEGNTAAAAEAVRQQIYTGQLPVAISQGLVATTPPVQPAQPAQTAQQTSPQTAQQTSPQTAQQTSPQTAQQTSPQTAQPVQQKETIRTVLYPDGNLSNKTTKIYSYFTSIINNAVNASNSSPKPSQPDINIISQNIYSSIKNTLKLQTFDRLLGNITTNFTETEIKNLFVEPRLKTTSTNQDYIDIISKALADNFSQHLYISYTDFIDDLNLSLANVVNTNSTLTTNQKNSLAADHFSDVVFINGTRVVGQNPLLSNDFFSQLLTDMSAVEQYLPIIPKGEFDQLINFLQDKDYANNQPGLDITYTYDHSQTAHFTDNEKVRIVYFYIYSKIVSILNVQNEIQAITKKYNLNESFRSLNRIIFDKKINKINNILRIK
jgi:hypothetical protein